MEDFAESSGIADNGDSDFEKLSRAEAEGSEVTSTSLLHGVEEVGPAAMAEPDIYGAEAEPKPAPVPLRGPASGFGEPLLPCRPSEGDAKPEKKEEPSGTTCCMSSCCAMIKNIDPKVIDLVLWRDVKKTGVVFGSTLVLLISLALCSVLSVLAYLSLVVLTMTASYRVYHNIMCAMKKAEPGHPFRKYLDHDLTISKATADRYADLIASHLSKSADKLRRLIFVEDIIPSLKFGLILWVMTYVGSWFNGITLLIIADVAAFSLPKVYDVYKVQIDRFAHCACIKCCDTWKKVQDKFPVLAKKKQA